MNFTGSLSCAAKETLPARVGNSVVQIYLPTHERRVAYSRSIWHALFKADVRHNDVACASSTKSGGACLGLKEEKEKVGLAEGGNIRHDNGSLICSTFGIRGTYGGSGRGGNDDIGDTVIGIVIFCTNSLYEWNQSIQDIISSENVRIGICR